MGAELVTRPPAPRARWEAVVWPRWLPVRARLPLIAQIAGTFALIAAVAMPPLSAVRRGSAGAPAAAVPESSVVPSAVPAAVPAAVQETPTRPAHLNLDIRHSFQSVDLSITVDGKRVLDTKLTGSGKRFGVFGKRAERSFTRSLDLPPGVRVVGVRVRSAADKFDQRRVARFDLDPATVAGMRIEAEKSGLTVITEQPPPQRPLAPVAQAISVAQVAPLAQATPAAPAAQQADAVAELYVTLRSILIAIAGFIASAATGFVVQEFLRSRKQLIGL